MICKYFFRWNINVRSGRNGKTKNNVSNFLSFWRICSAYYFARYYFVFFSLVFVFKFWSIQSIHQRSKQMNSIDFTYHFLHIYFSSPKCSMKTCWTLKKQPKSFSWLFRQYLMSMIWDDNKANMSHFMIIKRKNDTCC